MSPSTIRSVARPLALIALAFVGVMALATSRYGIILGRAGSYPHHLQTVVPSAFEVVPGQRVVAAGKTVGEVTKAEVTDHGQARVVLGIRGSSWPIPTDSVLRLRMSGTIKYTDRYVEIARGRAASAFADDGLVPARQVVTPVEYDQVFNIFDRPTRAGLRTLMANAAPTLTRASQPLRRALPVSGPAISQAAAVFRDLGDDQRALSTLVASTAHVSRAVATSNPGLRTMISGAADTFATVASRSAQLRSVLDTAGESFGRLTTLADHGTRSLPQVAELADRLGPGITQLRQLAPPLNRTLASLVDVEPAAVSALTTVRRDGPQLNRFLRKAGDPLMKEIKPIGTQAAKELNCVRPYTPDILNFFWTWAGWNQNGLTNPKYKLAHWIVTLLPFPNNMPMNAAQMNKMFPELKSGNPTPPGAPWGQPWYLPECHITPLNNSPQGDSENNTFDPMGLKSVPFDSTTPKYDK